MWIELRVAKAELALAEVRIEETEFRQLGPEENSKRLKEWLEAKKKLNRCVKYIKGLGEEYSRYELWQIPINKEMSEKINRGEEKEYHEAYVAALFDCNVEPGLTNEYYRYVADVYAHDLEDAFSAGNLDGRLRMLSCKPTRSISVGDILVDPTGQRWAVDSYGFKLIPGKMYGILHG